LSSLGGELAARASGGVDVQGALDPGAEAVCHVGGGATGIEGVRERLALVAAAVVARFARALGMQEVHLGFRVARVALGGGSVLLQGRAARAGPLDQAEATPSGAGVVLVHPGVKATLDLGVACDGGGLVG
jgi:hypothetical protein